MNYWQAIDKLAKSLGFALTRKVADSRSYSRSNAAGDIEKILFSRGRSLEGNVSINVHISLAFAAVTEIEERVLGTSDPTELRTHTGLSLWRINEAIPSLGLPIPKENPETSVAWETLSTAVQGAMAQFNLAPTVEQLLTHIHAGLKTINDPGSVWPWMPSGHQTVLLLLTAGRSEEAALWAKRVMAGTEIYMDERGTAYPSIQEKEWARILCSKQISNPIRD